MIVHVRFHLRSCAAEYPAQLRIVCSAAKHRIWCRTGIAAAMQPHAINQHSSRIIIHICTTADIVSSGPTADIVSSAVLSLRSCCIQPGQDITPCTCCPIKPQNTSGSRARWRPDPCNPFCNATVATTVSKEYSSRTQSSPRSIAQELRPTSAQVCDAPHSNSSYAVWQAHTSCAAPH